MRLDVYLVENGYFGSRGRAKDAILRGTVKVDGVISKKPSKNIRKNIDVQVEQGYDLPRGYFKLKNIQEATEIISFGDQVLDLGSSAGGFLMLASEIAGSVKGVEYSQDFRYELEKLAKERSNIAVVFGDVFHMPLNEMSDEQVDVILSDMTLEPMDALIALERILPLLRENGKLLLVIKTNDTTVREPVIENLMSMGLTILEVIESKKKETYITARKQIF